MFNKHFRWGAFFEQTSLIGGHWPWFWVQGSLIEDRNAHWTRPSFPGLVWTLKVVLTLIQQWREQNFLMTSLGLPIDFLFELILKWVTGNSQTPCWHVGDNRRRCSCKCLDEPIGLDLRLGIFSSLHKLQTWEFLITSAGIPSIFVAALP